MRNVALRALEHDGYSEYGINTMRYGIVLTYNTTKFSGDAAPKSMADLYDTQRFPGKRCLFKYPQFGGVLFLAPLPFRDCFVTFGVLPDLDMANFSGVVLVMGGLHLQLRHACRGGCTTQSPASYFAGMGTSINVPFPGSSNAWLEKEVELKHAFEEAFGRI